MTRLPLLAEPSRLAVFVDFDGTLVEIAERPDRVVLAERTRATLAGLSAVTGGAVAIITGRDIATIDSVVAPLKMPVAGVHGLTRRTATGQMCLPGSDTSAIARLAVGLEPLLRDAPGLLIERKIGAVALHYRARPDLEARCRAVMQSLVAGLPELQIKHGHMVVEVKLGGADKGTAIQAFMREEPFAGREPLYVGDDTTDEDGFAVVNAMGGTTIKIGDGPTLAKWRAATTVEFLDWLHALAK